MAYRNGTYIAFHAQGSTDPTDSDIKYYRLLLAWHENEDIELRLVNSHEKTAAVRDTSLKETLRNRLKERLRNSRNMVLILTDTTRNDTDWVPFEIRHAIDECEIPIIAAYPGYKSIRYPESHRHKWPTALAYRIDNGTAHVIHVPFKQEPLKEAIETFDHERYPKGGGLGRYSDDAYRSWGLMD
jgi:hypothetical protein